MKLLVYRIDSSFFGKLNNTFKKPDLPLMASAGLAIGNPFKNTADFFRENFYVLIKKSEIERFKEAFGNSFLKNIYYIRHPKDVRTNILIPSTRFHDYIIREQLSDIISYIRANLKVKKLKIQLLTKRNAELGMNTVIRDIPVEGNASVSLSSNTTIIINCATPLKPSEKRTQYIWIEEFQHLKAMIDDAENGKFTIKEDFDLSFGANVRASKVLGFNMDFAGNRTFKIDIEAA